MEVEEMIISEGVCGYPSEESYDSDLPTQGQIDPSDAFAGFSPPASPLKQGVYEAAQKIETELKLLMEMPIKNEAKEEDLPIEQGRTSIDESNYTDQSELHANRPVKKEIPKEYLLPFEMGWKRELNLYENSGNVVYIHPLGLRFRSLDDLTPHLTDGLNIEHFSFNLEPLHAGPENETITKDDPEKRLPAEMKDLSLLPTVRKSGRVPVPSSNYKIVERMEEQSRKRILDSPLTTKREKLVIKIKPTKLHNASANGKPGKLNSYMSTPKSSLKKSLSNGDPSARQSGDAVPIDKPIRIRAQFRKKNTTSRKKNGTNENQNFGNNRMEEISNWTAEKSGDEEPRRICFMGCAKAMGIIPTLQCCVCLCLYHPECAEVGRTGSLRQIHGYICKSCRNKPDVRKPNLPTEITPPPAPASQPTPKPSVPQHIVTYEGLRFVIVPNLGVTPPAATPGPALPPPPVEILASEAVTNLNPEGASITKPIVKQEVSTDMNNLISNICSGYTVLFHVFKYLSMKDLVRAAPVCRLWKDLSQNQTLWKTVRTKDVTITDWKAFAKVLAQRNTERLDLRQLLNAPIVQCENGYVELCNVPSLQDITLPKVSMSVLTNILKQLTGLRICFAQVCTEKETDAGLDVFTPYHKLEVLKIKCQDGEVIPLNSLDLSPLASTLTSLSLLSFTNWAAVNISSLASLTSLTELELGSCTTLPDTFSHDLRSLTQLQRVRLENGSGACHTIGIIQTLGMLPHLKQLELINFDGQPGLDEALANLKNIRSFLLIPSFVTQAGTTISSILKGIYQLRESLSEFFWVFTLEFLQVTELYIDKIKTKNSGGSGGNVPILMPLPVPDNTEDSVFWKDLTERYNSGNFAVVPMSELEEMLAIALPTTKTFIFKLPSQATLKQTIAQFLQTPKA